ncbi:MAG TPA: DUF2961 domain-containing protein [Candidatus Limiplasma sp.]|nr:DUF2961 domain-containing protein [Candidatus Limiplasma sp.]
MNSDLFSNPLGGIAIGRDARSFSVCAENPTGGKGMGGMAELADGVSGHAARDLGRGWKVNPYVRIPAGETAVLMDVDGEGSIDQIWLTCSRPWRNGILRFYWDGAQIPAVECPVGDFFCSGWNEYSPVRSLPVCVNPHNGFNSYWPMPFRRRARVTFENRGGERCILYYQINYSLHTLPEDALYFCAQFRRQNPLPYKEVYTLLDGVTGHGHYAGTYMAWGVNSCGWWGEGEIKFFIDGDVEFPTICGTGTEDYFGGAYNFENTKTHAYEEFSTPYSGLCQVVRPDGLYQSQTRFGLYRFHLTDPVCFHQDLRVTIQALGWRSGGRYLLQQDDIASVAFWYQNSPMPALAPLPSVDDMEII